MKKEPVKIELALADGKTKKAIFHICCYCKKIKDDIGSWYEGDINPKKLSLVEISHAMCPDCAKKFFPEITFETSHDFLNFHINIRNNKDFKKHKKKI